MDKFGLLVLFLLIVVMTSCENSSIKQNQNDPVKNVSDAVIINSTNITVEDKPQSESILVPHKDNLSVYYLGTAGEAIIIQQNQYSILINSGYKDDSKEVLNALRKLGIDKPNIIFATNTQPKNIGGLPFIILRSEPGRLYDNGIPSISSSNYKLLFNQTMPISSDSTIELGKIIIQAIVPYDDGEGFADNDMDNSIILRITFGTVSFLFMSDCGFSCEERIMYDSYLKSDVISLSKQCDSNTLSFIQKVQPNIAIFTTNETICQEVEERYDMLDVPIYKVHKEGMKGITTDGLSIS